MSTAKRERRRRANGPTRGARASRQRTNELARSLLVHLEVAVQLWLDLDDARQEVVDDALAAVGERVLDAGERLVVDFWTSVAEVELSPECCGA